MRVSLQKCSSITTKHHRRIAYMLICIQNLTVEADDKPVRGREI